jgi:hypothetical protein
VEALRSHGCMVARGPWLATPISEADLTARLRNRSRRQAPLGIAELTGTTIVDDTSSDDPLLTAALDDTSAVLESELSDLLRRVGASVLQRPAVVR